MGKVRAIPHGFTEILDHASNQRALDVLIPQGTQSVIEIAPEQYSEHEWLTLHAKLRVLEVRPEELEDGRWETRVPYWSAARKVDGVIFNSSLTRVRDMADVLTKASALRPQWILVYDNLMSPRPEWMPNGGDRWHIEYPALVRWMKYMHWNEERRYTADVIGKRWLRRASPEKMETVMRLTAMADAILSLFVPVRFARHSGWLFRRKDAGR